MRVSVILGHPRKKSFNHAIAERVVQTLLRNGHAVCYHEMVHPNWWRQPPAILKGWIDRVLRAGIAYEFAEGNSGEGIPVGLLKAKVALVFNTSNTPRARELQAFGDPPETLWGKCIFDLCGVRNFHRRMYEVVVTSTLAHREAWLRDVEETVQKCFFEFG